MISGKVISSVLSVASCKIRCRYGCGFAVLGLFVAKDSGTARLCEALELYRVVALGDLFQFLLGVDLHGATGDVGVARQTQDHVGRPRL